MIDRALLRTGPSGGHIWRIVEHQEEAATRNITRSSSEQGRLEQLLDAHKPAYPPATSHLNWILRAPFRYPPLRHGSRFGPPTEMGILYGARERNTAMVEAAVYLWLFQQGLSDLGPLEVIQDGRSALHFPVFHPSTADLTADPLRDWWPRISDPADYSFSQPLGSAHRQAGSGMIWFHSARWPAGVNCAVLDPAAIHSGTVPAQQQWNLRIDVTACWWGRPGGEQFEVGYGEVADATGRITHPALASGSLPSSHAMR
ncbi:RES family NAD+ phosphorylase [Parahaliea mediterranea]|uniref:RES family NAD+ phosphorylase n=1 Tax=Parahaliea mediterranea TaxID=651086 RepID=A0A939IN46_9GAMM|nr:RES family NAD+ phosphorylase [Parahaliea mediterranea]MBN7797672.1 RES family NAD+ phosphorylase [Parahaliea mediterranea]